MKVRLLPLAIAAAIAAPGVALADGPTVYGKFNVSYEYSDVDTSAGMWIPDVDYSASGGDDADTWELDSNASRFGVKGSENISDSLKAFYQAEFGIDVDEGNSGGQTLSQRDIFVGLGGNWGSLQGGRFDTPLKKSQGKVDQFNDMNGGDIGNVIVGEVRASDLIQYSSPKIADALSLNAAFQPGEEYCFEGAASDCEDGPAENFSVSAVYDAGGFYAALGYDDGIAGYDTIRLSAAAKLAAFELGAIFQTAEESEGEGEQDGYILSAAMKLGEANKLRFQYGASEAENYAFGGDDFEDDIDFAPPVGPLFGWAGEGETDVTLIALGFDHILSKQTRLYVNYIMLETEFDLAGTVAATEFYYNEDVEDNRLQLGIEHNF